MYKRTLLCFALGAMLGAKAWNVGATRTVAATGGQFDQTEVPAEMAALDFMLGTWTVEGAFRTPDHVGQDRALWYLTRAGGVSRFDGKAWTSYARGDDTHADAILAQVTERAAPYAFTNSLEAHRAQDGFVLIVDEGRTSGTAIVYYDTVQAAWIATALHAPTNTTTNSVGTPLDGLPVFEGRGRDRRGERIFKRRYEIHDANHFTIRTDVSFDEGVTWIDDQIVQEVHRQ